MTKRRWYEKPVYLVLALALLLSLAIVALPMAGTVEASPGHYYVATSGNDTSGDGSEGNPWRTIQHAVDSVNATDTINVAAGTYDEQVVIDKSLTLQGAGDTTVIQPLNEDRLTKIETVPWIGGGTKTMVSIVWADAPNETVTIKDLKVDGINVDHEPLAHPTVGRIGGIAYIETSGTVEDVTVVNMQTPTMTPRSVGIWSSDDTNPASTVEVKYSTVTNYNRGGIYGCGAYLTIDLNHNTITGPGVLGAQVPNGIFFLAGTMGSATYNTVSANIYSEGQWRSTGIGTYDAGNGITIGHNTIFDVQNAVALHNSHYGTVEYNTITGSHTGVRLESGAANNIIQGNDIRNNTYAIRASPSGGANEAHFNWFVGNTGWDTSFPTYVGAVSNVDMTNTLDAENNWWGDASGPYDPTGTTEVPPCTDNVTAERNLDATGDNVTDNVDYCPWLLEQYAPTKSVETATGTGSASFSPDAGALEGLTALHEATLPTAGKPNLDFPHGFFSFNITGLTPCANQTAIVTITLPSAVPVGTQYWKYHASEGGWIQIPMGSDDGDNVITITLQDGGLGDDDGVCNGVIVDQGGPGNPPPPVGGTAYPENMLTILAPWIAIGAAIVAGATIFARRRRAQG